MTEYAPLAIRFLLQSLNFSGQFFDSLAASFVQHSELVELAVDIRRICTCWVQIKTSHFLATQANSDTSHW